MIYQEDFINQIERRTYHDYSFKKVTFYDSKILRREVQMRCPRQALFRRHPNKISAVLITFDKKPIQKYYFNVLRIIKTLYQIFIESEWFSLTKEYQIKYYHGSDFIKDMVKLTDKNPFKNSQKNFMCRMLALNVRSYTYCINLHGKGG